MFVKMYQYHIQQDKVEDYLNIQEQASKIYSRYLNFHTMYFNSKDDKTKWIEISRYKDEYEFNKCMSVINEQKEIQELFVRFRSLLVSEKQEISEGEFIEMKEISSL